MPLPQDDPSLPGGAAPLFSDTDAARGDHLRANNQAIWENLQYLFDFTGRTTDGLTEGVAHLFLTVAERLKLSQVEPVGTYLQFAGAAAPSGYLACDASAVSRTTYAALFGVIGTTYGVGDGSSTFNLPDARGLVMVGAGAHGTMTRANGTAFNGGTLGASRNDQMQGHRHSLSPATTPSTYSEGEAGSGNVARISTAQTVGDPTTDTTNGTPRTGNETRPAEIAVLVCIKY